MSLWVREAAKMPNENTNKQTHTHTLKVARLTIHYVAWYHPNILLFHSDLRRQLNTLTLPLLTSVTWHSHLWLPLHTLKRMNSHSTEHIQTQTKYTPCKTPTTLNVRKKGKTHWCMCVWGFAILVALDCKNKNLYHGCRYL